MSFVTYLKNAYSLKGLKEVPELNGKNYSALEKPIQKKLKSATIHAICIQKESQDIKYEIFARLNQGSVALKEQELRNCIFRGSFNNMLEDIAKTNTILPQLFLFDNNRKKYQELILRFFALRDFANYKSSMPKTLNFFMQKHQNDSVEEIMSQKELFNGTIDIIKKVLGQTAFAMYDKENMRYLDKFSYSVYDSIAVPFSSFDKHLLIANADKIRKTISIIRETDDDYRAFAEKSTTSKFAVVGRITTIFNAINTCISSKSSNSAKRIFDSDIKDILWHDNYICSYCGNTILSKDDAEIDHIYPYSLGGDTSIDNAQLLHRHCNREKSDSELDWNEDEDDNK